jgi:hypothetical protein
VEVVGVRKRTPELVWLRSSYVEGVGWIRRGRATRVEYVEEPTSAEGGDEDARRHTTPSISTTLFLHIWA